MSAKVVASPLPEVARTSISTLPKKMYLLVPMVGASLEESIVNFAPFESYEMPTLPIEVKASQLPCVKSQEAGCPNAGFGLQPVSLVSS